MTTLSVVREIIEDSIEASVDIIDKLAAGRAEHDARDHVTENAKIAALDIEDGTYNIGFERIMQCVNDPTIVLNAEGEKLFRVLAHSYTFKDESVSESALLKSKVKRLTEQLEENQGRMAELMATLNAAHTDRLKLDAEYRDFVKSNSAGARGMLRSVMSSIEDVVTLSNVTRDQIDKTEQESARLAVEIDGSQKELDELQKLTLGDMFNARALLFSDPMWKGKSEPRLTLAAKQKETLIDAFKGGILQKLSDFNLPEVDATIGVFAVPQPSGVLSATVHGVFSQFEKSEVGKKLSNIAKVIHTYHMDDFNEYQRDVILTSSPDHVKTNDLLHLMYYVNLTAMAGYDPIRWARSFGVPISGIGKQILNEWDNGRRGPVTPERLVKIFESAEYKRTLPFDFSSLDLSLTKEVRREVIPPKGRRRKDKSETDDEDFSDVEPDSDDVSE